MLGGMDLDQPPTGVGLDPVSVYASGKRADAELVAGMLRSCGVYAEVWTSGLHPWTAVAATSEMTGVPSDFGSNRVMVRREDSTLASQLIASDPVDPNDMGCNSWRKSWAHSCSGASCSSSVPRWFKLHAACSQVGILASICFYGLVLPSCNPERRTVRRARYVEVGDNLGRCDIAGLLAPSQLSSIQSGPAVRSLAPARDRE